MENNNNVLEIRGLNSYFFTEKGVAPAVDGLDLDIPKGKIIGLVGESGCGKSTLGRTLIRMLPATRGSVTFEGQNITAMKDKEFAPLRRRMQAKLWQALYFKFDYEKEYLPQLEENLVWLGAELQKLTDYQQRRNAYRKK